MSFFSKLKIISQKAVAAASSGGSSVWGAITGNILNQDDLVEQLDLKANQLQVDGLQNDVDSLIITATNLEGAVNTLQSDVSAIEAVIDVHSGTIDIDFGKDGVLSENDLVIVTVVAAWVTSTTKIQCFVENDGVDHDGEDVYLENIIATAYNIVPNTSFDIIAVAHNLTWGKYKVTYKELI